MSSSRFPISSFKTQHFISNEFVSSLTSKTEITVTNPLNKKEVCKVEAGDQDDVNLAVASSKLAFEKGINGNKAWKDVEGKERYAYLMKLADLVERDLDELTYLDTISMGGATVFNYNAVPTLKYCAGWAQRIVGQTTEPETNPDGTTVFAYTLKQPFGVVVAIIPWNIPTLAFIMKLAYSLSTGNTVVIKPSEKAPLSAGKLCSLIIEAGFPPGVVNMVQGFGKPVGEALALHMDVRKISFTGSGATGKLIAANAARSNLKNVSLELGGKSASIVFEDADIDRAVAAGIPSVMMNAGQICVAHSRLYVHESIASAYIETLEKAIKLWKVGDPLTEGSLHGPLADEIQFEKVLKYLEAGKKEGKVLVGGNQVANSDGLFIEPTVFTEIPDDAIINREEIFGPVMIVHTFKTEEEVVARANLSEYGLSGAVHTKDLSRAVRVARALETGMVSVNGPISGSLNNPFGGWKQSGIGRENSSAYLESYLETKTVSVHL